jgi:hypothetical protein
MTAMTARAPEAPELTPANLGAPVDAASSTDHVADLDLMMQRHRMAVGQGPFNFLTHEESLQPETLTSRRTR